MTVFANVKLRLINNLYHTIDEINERLEYLLNSEQCKHLLTRTIYKPAANAMSEDENITITYYTLTDNESLVEKTKVFLLFGIHPREFITSEIGLYIIESLCGLNSTYDANTTKHLLYNHIFYLVPFANVRGRRILETGHFCIRTNWNGVDLNRNWDSFTELFEADHIKLTSNPGSFAFSEIETSNLRDIIIDLKPDMFIDFHSGSYGMFTPYAHFRIEGDELLNEFKDQQEILRIISDKYLKCKVGQLRDLVYHCSGSALDYVYAKLNLKFAFAFELFKKNKAGKLRKRFGKHSQRIKVFRTDEVGNSINFVIDLSVQTQPEESKSFMITNIIFKSEQEKIRNSSCVDFFNPTTEDEIFKSKLLWSSTTFDLVNSVRKHTISANLNLLKSSIKPLS